MDSTHRVGFVQGRLSPLIDGRTQAFPWPFWQDEFPIAARYGFPIMEWTLDHDRLHENPLMTDAGQAEIKELCRRHGIGIPSLTCDFLMQAPFWKAQGAERVRLQQDFRRVAGACKAVGVCIMVVPLVDAGRLERPEHQELLTAFLEHETPFFKSHGMQIAFESDYPPAELARFIDRLDRGVFGINYDIGNSAALGFDPAEEIAAIGDRILNIHVKDRLLGGVTVPLGMGNADFAEVFWRLGELRYSGNYILQTARAASDDHAEVLCRYRDMTTELLKRYGA